MGGRIVATMNSETSMYILVFSKEERNFFNFERERERNVKI